jgi:hypothetical protein
MAAEEGLSDGFRKLDDLVLHLKGSCWSGKSANSAGRTRASCSCTGRKSIACAASWRGLPGAGNDVDEGDLRDVIELLRLNYDRAVKR